MTSASYSLYGSTVQQPLVLCDLSLQLHLDVEQKFILSAIGLDVATDLSQLLLQPMDDVVVPFHLCVVAHLDVSQRGLQAGSLLEG